MKSSEGKIILGNRETGAWDVCGCGSSPGGTPHFLLTHWLQSQLIRLLFATIGAFVNTEGSCRPSWTGEMFRMGSRAGVEGKAHVSWGGDICLLRCRGREGGRVKMTMKAQGEGRR